MKEEARLLALVIALLILAFLIPFGLGVLVVAMVRALNPEP